MYNPIKTSKTKKGNNVFPLYNNKENYNNDNNDNKRRNLSASINLFAYEEYKINQKSSGLYSNIN